MKKLVESRKLSESEAQVRLTEIVQSCIREFGQGTNVGIIVDDSDQTLVQVEPNLPFRTFKSMTIKIRLKPYMNDVKDGQVINYCELYKDTMQEVIRQRMVMDERRKVRRHMTEIYNMANHAALDYLVNEVKCDENHISLIVKADDPEFQGNYEVEVENILNDIGVNYQRMFENRFEMEWSDLEASLPGMCNFSRRCGRAWEHEQDRLQEEKEEMYRQE